MSDDEAVKHVGRRGSVEVLPVGTTERECRERGERIYLPSELDDLRAELRAGRAADDET